MIWTLYYLVMYLMVLGIRISTLWNTKSKKWIAGRKGWKQNLKAIPEKKNKRVWFHVSSLGEFEQARPVIESIKKKIPAVEIVLTFYSPSGFELRSNYLLATVMYLPADLPGNAKKWVAAISPDVAIFVKYDLWSGYLAALAKRQIPTFLISAHWIPDDLFSSWALPPNRNLLKGFKKIFLQKDNAINYFKKKGFHNVRVAGDTRIDRSLELPSEVSTKIPEWLLRNGHFDLIAGSTWLPDEKILVEVIRKMNLNVILAPHDVSASTINRVFEMLPDGSRKLSTMQEGDPMPKVILVDTIGLLSVLYSLGKIAYIGGGFGSGIHNILEPMAHAKPILFGPGYRKFPEAIAMVEQCGAWSIKDAVSLQNRIAFLLNDAEAAKAGTAALSYLNNHSGATSIVTNSILESISYNDNL